jgi:1-hydroxycarotenoid 3,4-desaturase
MRTHRVVVIGAGVGGLAAAVDLAARGIDVTLVEAAAAPGGKMRTVTVGHAVLDAGPTVLTMRGVLDRLFDDAGSSLDRHIKLSPLDVLARHAWSAGERLDLFADTRRSADAIGDFAGAGEAEAFLRFARRSREIFETLEHRFMHAQRPNPASLVAGAGLSGLSQLVRISPFSSMWRELGQYFRDPRLRQLFARYATYCGSSPFQAPATLMLVAHAEQQGVWSVDGGMHRLAQAMAALAQQCGATLHYRSRAVEILVSEGRAHGVRLASGQVIEADSIVFNGDNSALAMGLLGSEVSGAVAITPPGLRSLSAVTWLVHASTDGFPLHRHNVFFSDNYAAEFEDIFKHDRLPSGPTVYVCALDRTGSSGPLPGERERLLCLVNAPPAGDRRNIGESEVETCRDRTFHRLNCCGLHVEMNTAAVQTVTPRDFSALFPGTGGALYGRASHGWMASFQRPGARSRVRRLYLAGGSTHPGPGVPMAAISGRLAAQALVEDLVSTGRFRPTGMRGGTSTRSATTAPMD